MTKLTIGKRTQVADIREVWVKETDFSDWLTTQEGIELIAQDLGVLIENPVREARGSNFPCDVRANVVGDEKHIVVIENQFGRTNHDHLAKLLTYAAAHKAMTGIWIAGEAADDHRQVIDWLNENTPETVALYLAEIKAYTIGNSPAAPELDLVCRPNVTMKQQQAGLTESEIKRQEWFVRYWEEIQARVKPDKPSFRFQKPPRGHWSSIAIGRSGFHVNMLLTRKNQSIGVELVVQPKGWKDVAFKQLQDQAQAIEAVIGRPLQWREMADQASSRILLEEKLDPGVEANRKKVCDWFALWTPKIVTAFQERVKALAAPPEA